MESVGDGQSHGEIPMATIEEAKDRNVKRRQISFGWRAIALLIFMTGCTVDLPASLYEDANNTPQEDGSGPPCTPGVDCPIPEDTVDEDSTGTEDTASAEDIVPTEDGAEEDTVGPTPDTVEPGCTEDEDCFGVFEDEPICKFPKCIAEVCKLVPREDGFVCGEPSNECEKESVCQGGQCMPGGPLPNCLPCEVNQDCPNTKATDKCMAAMICVNNFCEFDESTAVICEAAEAGECKGKICNPDTGICEAQNLEGAFCEIESACILAAACSEGMCVATELVDCGESDPDACINSKCNEETGVCEDLLSKEEGDSCQDGDPCTVGDACTGAGECVGEPMDCGGNECAPQVCDAVTGNCVPGDIAQDYTECDDGDDLSLGDWCKGGECIGFQFVEDWSSDADKDYDEPDAFIDATVTNTNLIHGMARYQENGNIKHKISIWDGEALCCATVMGTNLDSYAMDSRYTTVNEDLRAFGGEASEGWQPVSGYNESLAQAWSDAILPADWTALVYKASFNPGPGSNSTEYTLTAMGTSADGSAALRECYGTGAAIGFGDPSWDCPSVSFISGMCDGTPVDGGWFAGNPVFVCNHQNGPTQQMRLLSRVVLQTQPFEMIGYDSILSMNYQAGQSANFLEVDNGEILVGGAGGFLAIGSPGGMNIITGITNVQPSIEFVSAVVHENRWMVLGHYETGTSFSGADHWVIVYGDLGADLSSGANWDVNTLRSVDKVALVNLNGQPVNASAEHYAYNKLIVDGDDNLWMLGGTAVSNGNETPYFYMKKAIWKYGE